MNLHRLRIQLDDTPGQLGRVAAALGCIGVNINDVDVLNVDGRVFADDLLIDLGPAATPAMVEAIVAQAGSRTLGIEPADSRELSDVVARCLDVAAQLTVDNRPVAADRIAEVSRQLVRADAAWVGCEPGIESRGVVARAVSSQSPEQGAETVRSVHGLGDSWVLAVPFELRMAKRVLVLVRDRLEFTGSEIGRVSALLRLVRSGERSSAASAHPAGTVSSRPLFGAVIG